MLIEGARRRAADLARAERALTHAARSSPAPPGFRPVLERETIAVIAEVKRSSPSKGSINARLNAAAQAGAYERGGAAAISVLTEPDHFGGSASDLIAVRAAVDLPVLKKDFHVHPIQLL